MGEISNGAIYFEASESYDSYGYSTTVYGPAKLSGNVLSLAVVSSGKLASNGVLYPFQSEQEITGIRQ